VDAVNSAVDHLDHLGANHAVVFRRDAAERLASPDRLSDGGLNRHQVWVAPEKGADWNQILGGTALGDYGWLGA
jgi:hypothetical protein